MKPSLPIFTRLSFIGILTICLTYNARAQNYFNGTTYTINLGCNALDYEGIEFINDKTYPLVLHWTKLLEDTVPGSSFDMCANTACYNTVPDTGSNYDYPVKPGKIGFFKMHYWTGDSSGTSTLKLYLYEDSLPNNGDTLTYILNISCFSVGIEKENNKDLLNIYPLPADNYINLNLNHQSNENLYLVNIFNALGQKVLSERIENVNLNRLDVSNLSNGVYLLEVKNINKKSLTTKKIIINH